MPHRLRVSMFITSGLMALALISEQSDADQKSPMLGPLSRGEWLTVVAIIAPVLVVLIPWAYQRATRGRRLIVFRPMNDFTPRRTGGGVQTTVSWDIDLPAGIPERTNCQAWFQDGRFYYPMKRASLDNSYTQANRQVAAFEIAPELMPPIGKEVAFKCRVTLTKGGGSRTLKDFVTFNVVEQTSSN